MNNSAIIYDLDKDITTVHWKCPDCGTEFSAEVKGILCIKTLNSVIDTKCQNCGLTFKCNDFDFYYKDCNEFKVCMSKALNKQYYTSDDEKVQKLNKELNDKLA